MSFSKSYTYSPKPGKGISFSISIKKDKPSFSIPGSEFFSAATKYQLKAWATKNVLPEFLKEYEASLQQSSGIIDQLFAKTADLKAIYLEKTKEYAARHWKYVIKQLARPMEEWYKEYDVKTQVLTSGGKEYIEPARGEYSKRNVYKMRNQIDRLKSLIEKGFEKFEASELKNAEQHYKDSVLKLNTRLQAKGIVDGCKFEIINSSVGVNLEIMIKHEHGITRAWTIIAEGEIQRPHYRYLVK
jgi:hypothetical protein